MYQFKYKLFMHNTQKVKGNANNIKTSKNLLQSNKKIANFP